MDNIIVGIATMASRIHSLEDTINSLLPQVDKIIVVQDSFKKELEYLDNDKIEVISTLDTNENKADGNKFYKVSEYDNVYYLTADDDLIYPPDYVKSIVDGIDKYDKKCIVSHHGRILKPNTNTYYFGASEKFMCLGDITVEKEIEFGGTGVMGFHTSEIKFNFNDIKFSRMADIEVGIWAKQNNTPIIVLKHNKNWLLHNSTKYDERVSIGMQDHPTETYQKIRLKDYQKIK